MSSTAILLTCLPHESHTLHERSFDTGNPEKVSWLTAGPANLSAVKRALYEFWITGPGSADMPGEGAQSHYPLSPAQARIHFLDQVMAPAPLYIRPVLLEIQGRLDFEYLQISLDAIIARHDPLHSRLRWHRGSPTAHPVDRFVSPLIQRTPPKGLVWRQIDAMADIQEQSGSEFDLESEPPVRLFIYALEPRKSWLLLLTHDIAFDGLSERILTRALAEGYGNGHVATNDAHRSRYSDFARQQHAKKIEGSFGGDVDYWMERLRDLPEGSPITPDFTPSGRPSHEAATIRGRLPPDLVQLLDSTARGSGATLFMILLAAFSVLLHRFGGHSDVVIGVPTSGRTLPGAEDLIGRFVNIISIRTELSGEVRFIDYLSRVRSAVLEAMTHAAAPFESIVEATGSERDPRDPQVFRNLFELIDDDTHSASADGDLSVDTVPVDKRYSYFDLSVELKRRRQHWDCAWVYRSELFRDETIRQLQLSYEILLRDILGDTQKAIQRLAITTTEPGASCLACADAPAPGGQLRHLLANFKSCVGQRPDQLAVSSGDDHLTYTGLDRASRLLAGSLRASGVDAEDRVAILVEASVSSVIAPLATLMAGAAYVPLDVNWPASRIEAILVDIRPAMVITDNDRPACDLSQWRIQRMDEPTGAEPFVGPLPDSDLDRLAYVIYTTGSTGSPKGVMVEHDQLANYVAAFSEHVGVCRDQTISLVQPLSVDSSVGVIFTALASGACVDVAPQVALENPERLAAYLGSREIDLLKAAPSHLSMLFDIDPGGNWMPAHALVSGGEALPMELARSIEHCGRDCALFNHYGPTETTVGATAFKVVFDSLDRRQPFVPIGYPLANVNICVMDRYMNILPPGAVGELCIGGRCVARGYWRRSLETGRSFIRSPMGKDRGRLYRTGDQVRMRHDGVLEFLGRIDDELNIRGWRIHPAELSAGLRRIRRIADAFVLQSGKPKRLTAYVVPAGREQQADGPFDPAMLRREASEWLPKSLLPDQWVVVDELPRTGHGKVDRQALTRWLPSTSVDWRVPPRTPTEAAVTEVLSELLGIVDIGVHDDFFALGGHSLLVVSLVVRLHEVLDATVSVTSIFESPTVADIARLVDDGQMMALERIEPVDNRNADYPLTASQLRLWLVSQIGPRLIQFNTSRMFHPRGALDVEALRKAVDAVCDRHEDLRTVFDMADDGPVQRVLPALQPDWAEIDLTHLRGKAQAARIKELSRDAQLAGFDLATGPLVRLQILWTAVDRAQIQLVTHHLISDGWSKTIFFRDLDACYTELSRGATLALPPIRVQLIDFAVWQQKRLAGSATDCQRAYWLRKLEGLPRLDLIRESDGLDPEGSGYMARELDTRLFEMVEDSVRNAPVTLYMFMLTALKILLARWSGQEDIVIGTPVANRYLPELEPVMGFLVNQITLRTHIPRSDTVRGALARVRDTCLQAFANSELPLESVINATNPERSTDVMPLFRIYFNMHVFDDAHDRLSAFQVDHESIGVEHSHFDLSFYIRRIDRGMQVSALYRRSAFSGPQVRELLDQYTGLLRQMAMGIETPVNELRLLTDSARSFLPDPAETLALDWPGPVQAHFDRQALASPYAVAVEHDGFTLSYVQLRLMSNRLAHYFAERGVGRGQTVAILAERGVYLVAAMLGIMKSGAAFTLLDPAYPQARLVHQLKTANAGLVVQLDCSKRKFKQVPTLNLIHGGSFNPELDFYPDHDPRIEVKPEDVAVVSFTSGSTGEAKAVLGCHRSLTQFTAWTAARFGLRDGDRYSLLSGLSHDPLQREIFTPLQLGARICIPDEVVRADPRMLCDWLRHSAVSVLHLTPAMGQLLARYDDRQHILPAARAIFFVGEPLSWRLVTRLNGVAPGAYIVNYYGTTETQRSVGYHIAFDPSERSTDRGPVVQDAVPLGRGIPGVQLLVLTPEGQLAGVGEVGEIFVRSHGLAGGYLDDPALTTSRFIPNSRTTEAGDVLYKTGDLGRYATDGNVVFLGRNDGQVNIRGYRVEPGEIETIISEHPGVNDVVVVCTHGVSGNELHAYMVSAREIPFREIRDFTAAKLPAHCVPLTYTRVESIPLTPNGKIDSVALPIPVRMLDFSRAPKTSLELAVARLFSGVLGIDAVNLDDRFFEIGGSSLSAVQLQALIERETGRSLPMDVLYRGQTVRSVVNHFEKIDDPANHCILSLAESSGPSLLIVPAAATAVPSLRPLARALAHACRSYGIQPLGLDDDNKAHDTITGMACFYLNAIDGEGIPQPDFIAGRCFGAVVAFEMARQLSARGERPRKLFVLDNVTPPDPAGAGSRSQRNVPAARAIHESLKTRIQDEIQDRIAGLPEPFRQRYSNTRIAHRGALHGYRPGQYDGDIVVIGASEEQYPLQADWAGLTSGQVVYHSVPGNHSNMFDAPEVDRLATLVGEFLV